jgi:hypothetical protein
MGALLFILEFASVFHLIPDIHQRFPDYLYIGGEVLVGGTTGIGLRIFGFVKDSWELWGTGVGVVTITAFVADGGLVMGFLGDCRKVVGFGFDVREFQGGS